MDFFFFNSFLFFQRKINEKGQESRNRIKNHTSLIFSENIKNPKTKTIPHLTALFEIPHGFFFLCLRERERVGFRVGWFKRECYSEKLRESVIVRYWEREREGLGLERENQETKRWEREGVLDFGLKRITTTFGGNGDWWSELRSSGAMEVWWAEQCEIEKEREIKIKFFFFSRNG